MKRWPMKEEQGATMLELLVVLVVLAVLATATVPPLLEWLARIHLELAATEVVGALRRARSRAIREHRKVAVKFDTSSGRVLYSLYGDGDGDGVRNADLRSGKDPRLTPPRPLSYFGRAVRFGFPAGARPRDPGRPRRRLTRLDDPIRFNRSDLASFGTLGRSTPGSVYLTDGRRLLAVRVLNRTGRIAIVEWDARSDSWR